jgi:general secretion pathway protein C
MGIDAILKRHFPGILCALLAQLVAASVLAPIPSMKGAPARHALAVNQDHATSAAPIISRNPFDSITGPLDAKPAEPLAIHQEVWNKDPYEDPQCGGARVLLITQAEDPAWSFVAMSGPDGKAILRRQGDEIGGQTVYYVGWDRVWLTGGDTRCQAVVGSQPTGPKVSHAATPPAPSSPASSAATAKGRGKKVPPEIAAKIHRVSETEFNIERGVVDQILENQADLMRSARIVPDKEGDKVVGVRMFGIRPDSLLGTLGLENGDRLSSINGFEIADPQKALEAYARLRTADHLTVSVVRNGKPINVDYNIK